MNKNIKNFISSIIAIVTMFSVILTMGLIFFRTTLINENTYKNVFENIGTYDKVVESINDNIGYTLVVHNIDKDILQGVISKDEVVEVIDSTVDNFIGFLNGKDFDFTYDMEKYQNRVDEAINKYLIDNSMYLNSSQKSDIENMKFTILNLIDSELQIINFNQLSKYSTMISISKLVSTINNNIVIFGCIAINILLLALFFIIWRKNNAIACAWIGYTLVASGLVVFLLSFSGYLSKFYEYVIIAIPYVAETVGAIIKRYLVNMSIIGAVVIGMGILFMSFYWKYLYKEYKNASSDEEVKDFTDKIEKLTEENEDYN